MSEKPKFKIGAKKADQAAPAPASVKEFADQASMVQSQVGTRPPKPIRLNLDLDPEIHDRLKRRALDRGVTVANLVRQLIAGELSN